MVDQTIALGVRPLDVATPLLTAARIKQSQMEQQQQQIAMSRDAIGAEARGLAPYVGKPEYAQMAQASKQRLIQQGVINSPEAEAGFDRDIGSGSPLALQSIIARTQSPELAFRQSEAQRQQANTEKQFGLQERQFSETQQQHERQFGLQEKQFAETQRQHEIENMKPIQIGETLSGPVMAVRDPKAPTGYRVIDPRAIRDAQTAPAPGAQPEGGGPGKQGGISAADLELDRKAGRNMEYLSTLAPDEQQLIRKVANYEINPQSLSIKGGHRERILTAAANFDNSYDQRNYSAFAEGLKKFQSGKQGDAVRSFNVGLEHIDQLIELGRALNNGDVPKINELKNWWKKNTGNEAPTNFDGLKTIVGAEIVKAIVGAGGTGEERANAAKTVSGASSMAQLEGIARTYSTAMGAQLSGLQRQYEQSTGRKDFDRLLSPHAIKYRDSHGGSMLPGGGHVVGGGAVPAPPPGFQLVQ